MFKLKQEEDEKLANYYDKMKAFSSQVEMYLPNDVLHQFVESLEVYKKASAFEQIKNAINHFMSNEGTSGNGMNMNENENGTVNNEATGTSGQRRLTSWEGPQSQMQIATL